MKNLSILFLLISLLFGNGNDERTITGLVMDETGEPLIGASVVATGNEENGTVTEFDGTFSLNIDDNTNKMKVTYIGYKEHEVNIEGKDHFEIKLARTGVLEEAIVTGYIADTILSFDPEAYEEELQVVYSEVSNEEISAVEVGAASSSIEESDNDFVDIEIDANYDMAVEESDDFGEIVQLQEKEKEKKSKPKTTWKRSGRSPNTTTLFVGDNEKLPLKGTQIAVTVDGFRARVLMDCFFFNDEDSQREGTFKLRLPQGATPYYFAFGESVYVNKNKEEVPFVEYTQIDFSPEGIENMRSDSWTNPKEAKVVEKEKAAFAYGSTVRKQIDPALAEWAGADVYNCRVFPLMPKKLHRIVIGYDMNLDQLDEDWLLNFSIPQADCSKVIDFAIADIPNIKLEIPSNPELKTVGNYKKFRLTNPDEKEIAIRYKGLGNVLLNSDNKKEGQYFAAAFTPNLPVVKNNSLNNKAIFALDVSLSSNPDKFNIWLNMLEKVLQNNKDVITEFNVLLFNVEAFWWKEKTIKNSSKNIADFLAFANTLNLEGASDLGLALSKIGKKENNSNIFLLSDAAITWGTSDAYELSQKIGNNIVFAYNTGLSGTGKDILQHLARESGGAIFSIAGEDELEKASKAFRNQSWKIESLKIKNASDILIAGRPEYVYAGQKLMISGRRKNDLKSDLELIVSQNGSNKKINIPFKNKCSSLLAKRTFGQMATEHLEEFDYATEKYSVSYAKHFKVPGKTCSMLMLETEEEYEEYNISLTEDQFVVNSSSVVEIIQNTLSKIGETLGSAKVKFQNWLDKLERMPGIEFEKSAALEMICERLDETDYLVESKGLSSKLRNKKDISEALKKELSNDKLDYDNITKFALARKEKYGKNDALKLLSSLVEKNSGDGVLARDVAFSAMEWELNDQAYFLLKRVLDSRPYEPQTYHAIAQALAQEGKNELALIYYEIAISTNWDSRFGEFKKIAGLDYMNFLKNNVESPSFKLKDFAKEKMKNLAKDINQNDADLLVTISWNTDNTDIDLHVKEPTGEVCFYQNKVTKIGGTITQDVTQGYGPEMYILNTAKKGKYEIKVNYYSSDANRNSTRTKIYATIYKNWGKKNEEIIKKVVTLKEGKEMQDILVVEL
ncbi:MAG: hypothetical protein ACI94Y_003426 [Maribacter sp.]|jgi:hypothetical protein